DFSHIPLPDESVDILCDMAGTSNYCFDHEDFLLKTLNPLLKKDSMLISSFLTFRNFSENSLIRPACRRNFREDTVREQLLQLSFIPEAENVSAVITKGGIYESYFRPGEKVTIYSFIGKRSG
ncbi:MAG: methyltransferase, partial [Clostridia bacterium]|nr:methyltransferase [Clostridia bacterium]